MILKSIYIILTISILAINCQERFFLGDSSDIKTAQIDLNDPNHQSLLQNSFNLSADEVRRIRIHSEQKAIRESSISSDINDRFKALKDDRKEVIRNKIFDIREKISPPEELTHEMAAYPSCNQNNESQWLNENNVTVKFSTTFIERNEKHLYLDTAVLRLFKLNPNKINGRSIRSADSNGCEETTMDAQIRVTVSTIQTHRRNRKDKKKRICNTIMLNVSHHGWVEIDVKRAINIWEKFDKQNNTNDNKPVMIGWLTIEVHDEEERPLKPGLYFEPPKCSQAYPALPWNAYSIYYSTPADMEKVPKSPRLDVKLVDLRGISALLKRSNSALNFNTLNHLNTQSSSLPISESESISSSSLPINCNENHTHNIDERHEHHMGHEFNNHNNNVNSEQITYYTDQRLNATAKQRIDGILFSTVSALSPQITTSTQHNNSPSSSSSSSLSPSDSSLLLESETSRRHIKRQITVQEIEQQLQQQQTQHQQQKHQQNKHKHNRNHHNRNRNINGRRHLKKQRHQHQQHFINNNNNNNKAFNINYSTSTPTTTKDTITKVSSINTNTTNIHNTNSSILIGKLRELTK